jgi:hypothetical protein
MRPSATKAIEAAPRYRSGDSLATIGITFNVNAATVRRELHRIGVEIRPPRGWDLIREPNPSRNDAP